ncbi:hypothetical protein GCM10011611_26330 [Aliidongia dinghuensis]|uniref:Uncharacterized protein n=1 Tax=Aliidongia dinghuensis TaxID=1867774 RepID=A0A8J2YTE2_9PROT|nr:hypothetical protein [Aliidongia dinghuensis]GGF19168.1 hypothetical protein GCM10011611_26330 [Aliidongia dinghuensis]
MDLINHLSALGYALSAPDASGDVRLDLADAGLTAFEISGPIEALELADRFTRRALGEPVLAHRASDTELLLVFAGAALNKPRLHRVDPCRVQCRRHAGLGAVLVLPAADEDGLAPFVADVASAAA